MKSNHDKIIPFDADGQELSHTTKLLGTYIGKLSRGCFSASIQLDNNVRLCFKSPYDIPNELCPRRDEDYVNVRVKIYLNESEQLVYDTERI